MKDYFTLKLRSGKGKERIDITAVGSFDRLDVIGADVIHCDKFGGPPGKGGQFKQAFNNNIGH
jgi:hypothetical protein